jgi:hypothetical protein
LRNGQPSLARGSYEAPVAQGQVLAFQREWQGERTLVAINYGDSAARLALPVSADMVLRQLYPAASGASAAGAVGTMATGASVMSATAMTETTAGEQDTSASAPSPSSVGRPPSPAARTAGSAQLDLTLPPLSVQVYRLR